MFGLVIGGCNKDNSDAMVEGPVDIQKQIDEINNNPNMPPQAKAMAIQQLKARQGGDAKGGRPTTTGTGP